MPALASELGEPHDTRLLRAPAEGAARARLTPESIRDGSACGATLHSYRLEALIGSGGMGTVYRATHLWLAREVAIKFIAPHLLRDADALARFVYEARACGTLDHPHIVHATDAGEHTSCCYLVTELIDGEDTARLVARRGPLSAADACQIAIEAALGLQHAHERGLVHRDVKPSNLLVDRAGVTRLIDFGIARALVDHSTLTASGQLLGTLDYLAPEQASDAHRTDIRADIYSLGCTLYFLLSGEPPFAGPRYQTPAAKIKGHLVDSPAPLAGARGSLSRGLLEVLEQMLAKNPNDRFATPGEVAQALAPFAAEAQLERLLADDLCYGLNEPSPPGGLMGFWSQRANLPQGARSAAEARRRPLTTAGAVGAMLLLGTMIGMRVSSSPLTNIVSPRNETPNRTSKDKEPSASRRAEPAAATRASAEVASPARSVPSHVTKAVTSAPVPVRAASPTPTTRVSAPRATTARTSGARLSGPVLGAPTRSSSPAAAGPMPTTASPMPWGKPEGGVEYQTIRYFGNPPPGFDPSKLDPGGFPFPPGEELPSELRGQIPPFMWPPEAQRGRSSGR